MKFFSTPAWSFGSKTPCEPLTSDKFTPGPGTYELREENQEVPAPLFGHSERPDLFGKNPNPGPGAYNEENKPYKSKSYKHLKPTHPKEKTDKNKIVPPGPGSYNPQKSKLLISYTMGNKVYGIPEDKPKQLGPGGYNPDYRSIHTARSAKFGQGQRKTKYDNGVPGPGSYESLTARTTGINFGRSERDKLVDNLVPGPGNYNVPTKLKSNGKSLTARRDPPSNKDIVPGPGTYDLSHAFSTPAFAVGNGQRSNFIQPGNNPGPGAYEPQPRTLSKAKSIGTGLRPPLAPDLRTPGPGAYQDSKGYIGEGVKISMNGRRVNAKPNENPGPGQYKMLGEVQMLSTGTTFGRGLRSSELRTYRNRNPGPADYAQMYRPKCCTSGWTFGKDPRSKTLDDDEPGPGQYDIPASLPDVPKYLMLQSNLSKIE